MKLRTQNQVAISVKSFLSNLDKLRVQGQRTLCDIAGLVILEGDVGMFTQMVSKYSNVPSTNMHKWITEYGCAVWDKEEGKYKLNASKKLEVLETYAGADEYFAHLMANSRAWFEAPEKKSSATALDVAKSLVNLAKKVADDDKDIVLDDIQVQQALRELRDAMDKRQRHVATITALVA